MTTRELKTLVCRLGERAKNLDDSFTKGKISRERYTTERIAIDTIVSFIAIELDYEPIGYTSYSDFVIMQESLKRKAETESRLKKATENKAKALAESDAILSAFLLGCNANAYKA